MIQKEVDNHHSEVHAERLPLPAVGKFSVTFYHNVFNIFPLNERGNHNVFKGITLKSIKDRLHIM